MFILIPEIVDQDHSLHPNAQKLCGYIIGLSNSKIGCIAGNKYFEKRLAVSASSVKRYLKDLKEKGYIQIENIPRENKTPIRIIVPTSKILTTMQSSKNEVYKEINNKNKSKKLPNDLDDIEWLEKYVSNL